MSKPFEAKHLFLTYPQCFREFSKEEVLAQIQLVCESQMRTLKKYVIGQEYHLDNGLHFHAYLELDFPIKTRDARIFDLKLDQSVQHPNIQKCRNPLEVRKYCIKDGDYITNCEQSEFEEKKTQRDVQRIIGERVLAGESLCTIIREYPEQIGNYSRLVQSVSLFRLHCQPAIQTNEPRGIWIYGETGVGKSHFVREYCRQHGISLFIKPNGKWWDGYSGQQAILLDDYDKRDNESGHDLKIWLDKYAITAEVKCSTVPLMYKLFFITSQYTISNLFQDFSLQGQNQDRQPLRDAIRRRVQFFERTSQNDTHQIRVPLIETPIELQKPDDSEEMDL